MALRTAATRGSVLLLLAVALSTVHLPGRPTTLCLLRTVTGLPCPLCGGTTAAARLGNADLLGALRASPLAVLGAVAFVLAPVRRFSPGWPAFTAVALLSELWQLHRFGYL